MLTVPKIKRKAGKLGRLYKERQGRQPGHRADKALFIFYVTYSEFKEKYPERKIIFSRDPKKWNLQCWLEEKFEQYYNDNENSFAWERLYKWMQGGPFKEMRYQKEWDDIKIIQKICNKIKKKGTIDQRDDIIRACGISRKELEDFTGFILSQNVCIKKTSNKFIFDRS